MIVAETFKYNFLDPPQRELNAASDELAQKQAALAQAQSELGTLKDSGAHQRRRATEMIRSLLQDLGEVGAVVAKGRDDLKKPDAEKHTSLFPRISIEK